MPWGALPAILPLRCACRCAGMLAVDAPARLPASPSPAGIVGTLLAALFVAAAAGYFAFTWAPPAASPAADGWASWLGAALLFLPRVLFWQPTAKVAVAWATMCGERAGRGGLPLVHRAAPTRLPHPEHRSTPVCAGAAAGALRSADHLQQLRGRPDVVPPFFFYALIASAWQPLLWWCCGGRWGAVLGEHAQRRRGQCCSEVRVRWPCVPSCCAASHLPLELPPPLAAAGTVGEFLPVARPLASLLGCPPLVATLVAYPAACWLLSLVAGWLPWGLLLAPVSWPLRHLVWSPSGWLCLPLTAYACWASYVAAERHLTSSLWLQIMLLAVSW